MCAEGEKGCEKQPEEDATASHLTAVVHRDGGGWLRQSRLQQLKLTRKCSVGQGFGRLEGSSMLRIDRVKWISLGRAHQPRVFTAESIVQAADNAAVTPSGSVALSYCIISTCEAV